MGCQNRSGPGRVADSFGDRAGFGIGSICLSFHRLGFKRYRRTPVKRFMQVLLCVLLAAAMGGISAAPADEKPNSQLVRAVKEGDVAAARAALDLGADANAQVASGATPLTLAALRGHTEVVKVLLEKGAKVSAGTLMGAVQQGHIETVKVLLENGADVNARLTNGQTPLLIAAWADHAEIVALLLKNGADIGAKLNDGATALLAAAQNGHVDVVKILLQNGADVNARWSNGETPLFLSAKKGYVEIVKLLLAKGADVDARRSDGATALMKAVEYHHGEVATLLKERGAH